MSKRYKGILCILAAAFCFAIMNACVRASGDLPAMQKAFFRNIVALVFAYAVLKKSGTPVRWKKDNFWLLFTRAAAGTIGVICNFYAVDHLVLSDATMLNKMSPFFAILFSFLLLKENLKLYQIVAVLGSFVGSLFIIKPTFSNMDLVPSLIGLVGGLGAGVAYTMVRKLGMKGENGEKGPLIVLFFSAFSCLVTLPYLLFFYQPMEAKQLLFLRELPERAASLPSPRRIRMRRLGRFPFMTIHRLFSRQSWGFSCSASCRIDIALSGIS